jgi:hypothetical protein
MTNHAVLNYATPARRTESAAAAVRRGVVLAAILLGVPVVMSIYIHVGAQVAYRIEGRTGSLDKDATGTARYDQLLIDLPLGVVTLTYLGAICWTIVQVVRDRWHPAWLAIMFLYTFLWFLFVGFHIFGIWDDISP